MYALEEIAADPEGFRGAVAQGQPFRPLYVKIKVIFGCNLRCQMCNHWRRPHERPLSIERFKQVVEELAALGCRKIHFSGGEALLRPQLPDLLAHTAALGIRTNLTSNGTLIDKELALRLVETGLRSINISLDSPEAAVHDQIRGMPGAWKQTTRAIRNLHRRAHKGKLSLRINTVVSDLNYETLVPLPDLAHSLGADSLNLIAVDDHCGDYLAPSRHHIEIYNATIAPLVARRALALGVMTRESQAYPFGFSYDEIRLARRGRYAFNWYQRHPCFAPWTHSLIDYNGDVYVCCMTRERMPPLGNLHHTSFSEIWHGTGYQAIRQQMHPPQLAACACCDDFLPENRRLLELAEPRLSSG